MKYPLILSVALLMLYACESPKEKSLNDIRSLESNDSIFSPEHIQKMEKAYLEFADKYPDDDLSPEFLFKAAQRCNVIAQHQEAISLFQRLRDKYPKHKMAEEALFLQGYIYENSMNDQVNARKVYQQFITSYPQSELAEDAGLALKNMGKTPEEILEELGK